MTKMMKLCFLLSICIFIGIFKARQSFKLLKVNHAQKNVMVAMSSSEPAIEVKTLQHVAMENSVKGKSWLRCKPIGSNSCFAHLIFPAVYLSVLF